MTNQTAATRARTTMRKKNGRGDQLVPTVGGKSPDSSAKVSGQLGQTRASAGTSVLQDGQRLVTAKG